MSSWKKTSKCNQRTHRERHQPESRQHLGLLEKKKDFLLRSRDAKRKEKTLKLLHRRALDKNPDEFYHHMINSKLHDGEHRENEKPDEHSQEQIALMETQDLKYIIMKRTIEARKIKRLQSQLHMIDFANTVPNKHTFFIENEDELKNFDLAEQLETDPSALDRKTNRPRLKDLEKMKAINKMSSEEKKAANALKQQAYQELNKRIEREKQLGVVQRKLELKRAIQQKRLIQPVKISPGTKTTPPVYEFKYERKK